MVSGGDDDDDEDDDDDGDDDNEMMMMMRGLVVDGGDTATELATSGERSWSSLDAAEMRSQEFV